MMDSEEQLKYIKNFKEDKEKDSFCTVVHTDIVHWYMGIAWGLKDNRSVHNKYTFTYA